MTDLAGARTAVPMLDADAARTARRFDPAVAEAATLPAELYTSPDVLPSRPTRCSATTGCASAVRRRVAEPGDWFTVTSAASRSIVVRDKAGEVQAMSAVCQHRAMQVCDGTGNSSTFKCPYHHWNYALDGRLLGAPAMERTDGFDKSDFGLPRLRVEVWQGFVFVNFDADAAPLAPTWRATTPYLANYDLANAVDTGTFTLATFRGTGR